MHGFDKLELSVVHTLSVLSSWMEINGCVFTLNDLKRIMFKKRFIGVLYSTHSSIYLYFSFEQWTETIAQFWEKIGYYNNTAKQYHHMKLHV